MPIEIPESIQKWFETQNVEIRLFPDETVKKFSSLSRFYDFIVKEAAFWRPLNDRVAPRFASAQAQLEEALRNSNNIDHAPRSIASTISIVKTAPTDFRGQFILFSETNFARELQKVAAKYGPNSQGCIAFIQGALSKNIHTSHIGGWSAEEFFGIFDAYIYRHLNKSLTDSLETTQTALSEQQSTFNVFLDQCEDQREKRQRSFEKFSAEYEEFRTTSEKSFREQSSGFDRENAKQLSEQQSQFVETESDFKKRITALEELYQNKLMLEAPVQYWTQLEEKHRKSGCKFAWASALSLCFMVGALGVLLYKWPPSILEGTPTPKAWDWNSLKASFLLVTIVSMAIYVVRFLAKFAVSAYHLSRDAEERKQLTYVYLSLLQKDAVSAEQQQIVLQALFSRADTGLLKGDHGPTMPSALMTMMDNK